MADDRAYLAEQFKPTERLLARLCLIIVAGFIIIACLLLWYGARFGSVSALEAQIEARDRSLSRTREMVSQARDRAAGISPRPEDIERLRDLLRRLDAVMEAIP
ncbi:MAG: hypothetical protein JJ916_04290 [Phycisphaerales bacterium]|nr:hypothetical protein [Phycisphaerales bacterium]